MEGIVRGLLAQRGGSVSANRGDESGSVNSESRAPTEEARWKERRLVNQRGRRHEEDARDGSSSAKRETRRESTDRLIVSSSQTLQNKSFSLGILSWASNKSSSSPSKRKKTIKKVKRDPTPNELAPTNLQLPTSGLELSLPEEPQGNRPQEVGSGAISADTDSHPPASASRLKAQETHLPEGASAQASPSTLQQFPMLIRLSPKPSGGSWGWLAGEFVSTVLPPERGDSSHKGAREKQFSEQEVDKMMTTAIKAAEHMLHMMQTLDMLQADCEKITTKDLIPELYLPADSSKEEVNSLFGDEDDKDDNSGDDSGDVGKS
ncbi:hypothetical protein KSP40_PGU015210 [Platanthera guangdongensis]|uniref:Uncharacterized protein n=1 Tax=Platanthera guangdongensis TaxID=2320717 RepID=A0ABR2MCM5_9ASPA